MNTNLTLSYIRTSSLPLCYDDAQIEALLFQAREAGPLAVLLSLPGWDACRLLAGLLPREARIEWAQAAARRAQEYAAAAAAAAAAYAAAAAADAAAAAANAAAADAAYAAAAATHVTYAAAYAANAANAYAANAADYAAAARVAEYALSVRYGCLLMGWS